MLKLKLKPKGATPAAPAVRIRLNARKTVSGDIHIYDHPHIDIALIVDKHKIVVFPKIQITDEIYATTDRFFDFLRKEGVIIYDSVQGGNVFWSMEAQWPNSSEDGNPLQFVLYSIFRFLQDDLPEVNFVEKTRQEFDKELVDPSADASTELGEVPAKAEKGSLTKRNIPWGGPFRTFESHKYQNSELLLEVKNSSKLNHKQMVIFRVIKKHMGEKFNPIFTKKYLTSLPDEQLDLYYKKLGYFDPGDSENG